MKPRIYKYGKADRWVLAIDGRQILCPTWPIAYRCSFMLGSQKAALMCGALSEGAFYQAFLQWMMHSPGRMSEEQAAEFTR